MQGITPKQRAKHLKKVLATLYDDGRNATASNITDMLTDLRHLCDAEGLIFSQLDGMAERNYAPEVAHNSINTGD